MEAPSSKTRQENKEPVNLRGRNPTSQAVEKPGLGEVRRQIWSPRSSFLASPPPSSLLRTTAVMGSAVKFAIYCLS